MQAPVEPEVVASRRLDVARLAGGLLILLLSAVVANDGRVPGWERAVFRAVNRLPGSLEPAMQLAQFLGVLAVGPAVALVAFALRRRRLALAAVSVTVLKLGLERVVKSFVERQRPGTSTPDAIVRGAPVHGLSFVSGHAVLAAALATVVSPYLRGAWKILPWSIVGLVGFARVFLGAHNPLDVIGGVGLGLAIGGATNLALGVPTIRTGDTPDR